MKYFVAPRSYLLGAVALSSPGLAWELLVYIMILFSIFFIVGKIIGGAASLISGILMGRFTQKIKVLLSG
jgi:hypothetical protein